MKPKDLLKKKNVIIYYTGNKVVGGVVTARTSIRVGVREKIPLAQLKKKDIIPARIQGVETDVFQTEEINAQIDRKARHRPAPPGVSVSHASVTAGTLGMIVKKDGWQYILSNNHVLANSNDAKMGDQTWQPGSYDGGGPADTIGHLSDFVPIHFIGDSDCPIARLAVAVLNFFATLVRRKTRVPDPVSNPINKVDCAISRPLINGEVSEEILEIGKPTGYGEAKVGDKVKKSGRTTGLTQGDVIATDGVSNVNYGDGKIAIFADQIITSAMSKGGDSGSAVLNEQNAAVGLLFAGSSSLTIINKIANVIDALGLDKAI